MMNEDICKIHSDDGGILEENYIGSIWHICFIANNFVFPIFARFDKKYKITRMEFVIIYVLSHRNDITPTDICRITGFPKNNVTRGSQKLEEKGLITRFCDDRDARRIYLHITDSGKDLFLKLLKIYKERADDFLSILDDGERYYLDQITKKLSRSIQRFV